AGTQHLRELFPHPRFHRAGLIGEQQRKILAGSGLLITRLQRRQGEEGRDELAVKPCGIGNKEIFHRGTRILESLSRRAGLRTATATARLQRSTANTTLLLSRRRC